MNCSAARVVSLKTRQPIAVEERIKAQNAPNDHDVVFNVPCVAAGNFCLCWMPAWFRLAEIVAAERKEAAEG